MTKGRAVVAVFAMLLSGAWMLQRPRPGVIPELPAPPPVPARALKAMRGTAEVTLRNVQFVTSLGAKVNLPLVEIKPQLPNPNAAANEVRVESIRLVGLRVVSPIDTVHTGLPLFMKIPGPRMIVDRVSIVDADIGQLAAPSRGVGSWAYRFRDLDLELRDIDIGGTRTVPDRLRVTRMDLVGESGGEPVQITHLQSDVRRTPEEFFLGLNAGFGLTRMKIATTLARKGDWRLELTADTVRFAELRAFADGMPREGTGKVVLSANKVGDVTTAAFKQASAQVGASQVAVHGQISTGNGGRAESLVVGITNLRPEDVKRAYDFNLPGDGPYNGQVTASGGLRSGIRLNGRLSGSAAGAPSTIALNGTVRVDPDPFFDLELTADPLRLADTVFNARVTARGSLERLHILGDVALRPAAAPALALAAGAQPAPLERVRSAAAKIDLELLNPPGAEPARLTGKATLVGSALTADNGATPVHAVADGAIIFTKTPTVSARVKADSLALDVLPWPADVEDVHGFARADFRIEGALSSPDISGTLDVQRGALFVRSAKLAVSDIYAPIRLRDDRLTVEGMTARVREGTVRVDGEAFVLGDDKRVNLTLRTSRVHLTADSVYVANADVRINGPLSGARAAGKVDIVDARTNRLSGTATGFAILARDGALEVDVAADSLPLASLPLPKEQVDEISGHVRGNIALRGTLADPTVNGAVRLVDAGARVRASGTRLSALSGDLRIENGVVITDVRGAAGRGRIALTGTARIMGERTLDLRFRADSAEVVHNDSAQIFASTIIQITGDVKQPLVEGRVQLVDGWVKEDVMLKNTVIDPEHPPYAELAARVPWISNSRLLRNVERDTAHRAPPFRGRIVIEVTPGISMVDEDSDLYGTGEVVVTADSAGISTIGSVRFQGGYYVNYGERFRVGGGGFGMSSISGTMLALRAERERDPLDNRDYGAASPLHWYPDLEIFAHGSTSTAKQGIRRLSPLKETQTELAGLLLYGHVPEPIVGLRSKQFWLPDEPGDLLGERAESQGGPLLWGYLTDELYDYVPLTRVSLRGGNVVIGSRFPGRLVQGPLVRLMANVTPDFGLLGSWVTEGAAWPGVRAQLRRGDFSIVAFSEPKFYASAPAGEAEPGYFYRRRNGIGLRFERDR